MMGLKDRLRNATTIKQVDALLAEGASYENASNHTRNQWHRVAARKRDEIRARRAK